MKLSTTLTATAAIAILALAATDLSASAQNMTNGPNGMAPNTLSSKTTAGKRPSRMMMKSGSSMHHNTMMHRKMSDRYGQRPMLYAAARPLVVRRPVGPVVAEPPAVAGPGTLVTGPLAFGSNVVALPFRGLGTIFPASGDVATNPLVLIGAPLRAVAEIVQVPFRLVGAPFGGTTIATY